jgi:hypothetical protein
VPKNKGLLVSYAKHLKDYRRSQRPMSISEKINGFRATISSVVRDYFSTPEHTELTKDQKLDSLLEELNAQDVYSNVRLPSQYRLYEMVDASKQPDLQHALNEVPGTLCFYQLNTEGDLRVTADASDHVYTILRRTPQTQWQKTQAGLILPQKRYVLENGHLHGIYSLVAEAPARPRQGMDASEGDL